MSNLPSISPLLLSLLSQTGLASMIDLGQYDIVSLRFNQDLGIYYGKVSLTIPVGLGLKFTEFTDYFGDAKEATGGPNGSSSFTLNANFEFSKVSVESIAGILENYMGEGESGVLLGLLSSMADLFDRDLFIKACDTLKYYVDIDSFVTNYNAAFNPSPNIVAPAYDEDYEVWAGLLYDLLPQSTVSVEDAIIRCLCEVDLSQPYDAIQYESRLTSIFSEYLGPYCVAKAKLQLHFYYKVALSLSFNIPLNKDFISAQNSSNPAVFDRDVVFSVGTQEVVLSNYVPFTTSNLGLVELTLAPGNTSYKIHAFDLILSNFGRAYLDLSTEVNAPGTASLGLPASTMGIYLESATLTGLPLNLSSGSTGPFFHFEGLFLGTNGFSGLIKLATSTNNSFKLGLDGLSVNFSEFAVLFQANRLASSTVSGTLDLASFGVSEGLPFTLKWYDTNSYVLSIEYLKKTQAKFTIAGLEFTLDFTFNNLVIHYFKDYSLDTPTQKLELSSSGSVIIGSTSEVLKKFFSDTKLDYWVKLDSLGHIDGGITLGLGAIPTGYMYRHEFKNDIVINFGKSVKLLVGPMAFEAGWPSGTFNQSPGSSTPVDFLSNLSNNFEFKVTPPDYLAVELDFGSVQGGGIVFQRDNFKRFEGLLVLTFQKRITITALAIYEDRNGQKSFIGLVSVEGFTPIQLGLGFALVGIGGLVGVNRTFDDDYIRRGLASGVVDRILFPTSNIKQLAPVLSAVDKAFPSFPGRYVFGLSAKITWGEKVGNSYVFSTKLALIISLPSPIQLALIGTGLVLLPPTDGEPVAVIRFAFMGFYSQAKGLITFDASIYDSKIQNVTLTGEVIARILLGSNGEQPDFLLSAGGYHPNYTPPAALQAPTNVKRLCLVIANQDGLRITAESYFGISKNVVMIGNRASLYAGFGGASINGDLSFEALVRFSPFQFTIDFSASVSVRYGGRSLCSLGIGGQVSGPNPWHIHGTVEFEIFWVKFSSRFSFTWPRTVTVAKLEAGPDYGVQLTKQLADTRNYTNRISKTITSNIPTKSLDAGSSSANKVSLEPHSYPLFSQSQVPFRVLIPRQGTENAQLLLIRSVNIIPKATPSSPIEIFTTVTNAAYAGMNNGVVTIPRDSVADKVIMPKDSSELRSYFLTTLVTNSANNVPASIKEAGDTYNSQVSGVDLTNTEFPEVSTGVSDSRIVNYLFEFYGDDMELIWPRTLEPEPLTPSPDMAPGSGGNTTEAFGWEYIQNWLGDASLQSNAIDNSVGNALDLNLAVSLKEKSYKVVYKRNHEPYALIETGATETRGTFSQITNHLELMRQTNPALYSQLTYIQD